MTIQLSARATGRLNRLWSTTVGLSETILAAAIGGIATIGTALVQLIITWKKQSGDRRTTKGGFRSLLWVLALLLASGVSGYAYSEYRNQERRDDERVLRQELQQQLQTLAASAARLEQVRFTAEAAAEDQARLAAERRRGVDGVAALVQVPACRGQTVAFNSERVACAEADAVRIAVCAVVPANAQLTEVQLFTRSEDSTVPWSESRVTAGQDAGKAKFVDTPTEQVHDSGKEVCHRFAHWNSDKGRTARILVRYTL
jgi:hypothetical protein